MTGRVSFDWQTGEDEYLRRATQHFSVAHEAAFSDGTRVAELTSPSFSYAEIDGAIYDHAFFHEAGTAYTSVRDGERALALFALRAMAALLFVLMAAGSASESPVQADRKQIERDLTATFEQDVAAWRAGDRDRYRALIDPSVPARWSEEWRDHWGHRSETGLAYSTTLGSTQRLNEEVVQAEVFVTLPRVHWWQDASVREARFYRAVNGQWLRTLPPDEYWGDAQTLASQRFVFHYFEADGESVAEAAERLDDAMAALYEIFDVTVDPEDLQTVVVIKPGDESSYARSRGDIEVSSPVMAQIEHGATEADYLAEHVFSRSTAQLFNLRGGGYRWSFLYTALRSWLSEELLGQPSRWQEESIEIFRTHAAAQYPLQLSAIDEYFVGGKPGRDTVLWRYAAAAALLDYMISLEGQEMLPELVAGFKSHGTWSGLINTVFDVTEEEFTAGWNEYLADEYGFGPPSRIDRQYGEPR